MNNKALTPRDILYLIGLTLANLFLYAFKLGQYHWFRYDESAYVAAARGMLDGQLVNMEHPPLGKYFISLGVTIFGDNPDGWRMFSVIVGVVGIIVVYLFAKRMFNGYVIPLAAATLMSVETYWFASARMAMLDIFLSVALCIGIYWIWRYFESGYWRWAAAAAIMIGSAAAIKWTGVSLMIVLWVAIVLRQHQWRIRLLQTTLIMGAVYLIFFLPLYLMVSDLPNIVTLHQNMLRYHTEFRSGADWFNGGVIQWFQSFPIQAGARYDDPVSWQRVYQVVYSGNIVILWAGLAVIVATGVRQFRKPDKRLGMLLGSIAAITLPWIIIPGTWNVFLPLVPLICIVLAYWCGYVWYRFAIHGKYLVLIFLALCIGWYVALLPRLWPLLYQRYFIDTLIV